MCVPPTASKGFSTVWVEIPAVTFMLTCVVDAVQSVTVDLTMYRS